MIAPADHPDFEALEDFAAGQGASENRVAVESHLQACSACSVELALLRQDSELFLARAQASRPSEPELETMWSAVAAKIERAEASPSLVRSSSAIHGRLAWAFYGLVRRPAAFVLLVLSLTTLFFWLLHSHPVTPAANPTALLAATDDDSDAAADPKVSLALDQAEQDTAHAVEVLEKEAAALRPLLPKNDSREWDETLQRARRGLDAAKLASAESDSTDVQSRMRLLSGYTRYLRSLQEMVKDTEEMTP